MKKIYLFLFTAISNQPKLMAMKSTFSVFALLFFSSLHAQTVNFVWAKQMGGNDFNNGLSSAVDASGNVYTTGSFKGTTDFDPGAGVSNLTSAGENDIFVSKLDASGNFVWARRIGGTDRDEANSIAVDAAGNVYTTGTFYGTVDFDPGAGTSNLTSGGSLDIFVSKLNAAGNFVWAKSMLGTAQNQAADIIVDAGNVYTTGSYNGTVDFDPGAGTFNLTAKSSEEIFVSKLTAAGNFVWAKSMGGSDRSYANAITVDGSGNVYTTGSFRGTTDFDPGAGVSNLTSAGESDIYVSKFDAAGNFVWARNMGGKDSDFATDIAVDASGNVYTTGGFEGTADFDPGTATINFKASRGDIFISKLNSSGNFVWAKQIGGGRDDIGISIAVDAAANVYTTGVFAATADFDPGAGTSNMTSAGANDVFISKLDSSGNFVYAKQISSSSSIDIYSIVLDPSANIYLTGSFRGTIDFDPGPDTFNLTTGPVTNRNADIFVVKLAQAGALPLTLTDIKVFQKNNGVQVEWSIQQEINIDKYEVEKSSNGVQFTKEGTVQAKGIASGVTKYNLFDPAPLPGLNFYRLKMIDKEGNATYSSVIKVNLSSGATMLTIYPNPVEGNTIILQMNNLRKGSYTITLTNKLGQQVMNKVIEHAGGSSTQSIESPKALSAGVYQLRLTGDAINILKGVIKK